MADAVATRPLGPQDDGRRMTLEELKRADVEEGYIYELAQGVLVVAELPSFYHMLIVLAIRDALVEYKRQNPGRVFAVAGGAESGLDLPESVTRRHPDISVYLSPPIALDAQPWDTWIPEFVIEVVSASSRQRDTAEKPRDYLLAGVRLYWIVDPETRSAELLSRRADTWTRTRVEADGTLASGLLPGFELKLPDLFAVLPS